ncbi:MAG TPA: Ca2+-dependent phosphoinositide-specific phospholipase C [Microthrixaceae bacterium]|nr:Ca2+-dependent phosphoinositide-specific phospholipase C [Microthrixaceae bacterium]
MVVTFAAVACSGSSDAAKDESPESSDSESVASAESAESAAEPSYPNDLELRLNQIQGIGTHNSYHPAPLATPLPAGFEGLATAVDYRHESLTTQLDKLGVRHVELDVWLDSKGGRWAKRPLLEGTGSPTEASEPEWSKPGLKVLHVAQLDPDSSCIAFVDCLDELNTWSVANPGHMPIMIFVEIKDVDFFDTAGEPQLEEWGPEEYDALDAEIRSVLSEDRIITPDEVQGDHATMEEALSKDGWPSLADSRGRFLFVSCNCLAQDRHRIDYVRSDGGLKGRVLFPTSEPGSETTGVILGDNPLTASAEIAGLVEKGYLVRTRSDANTVEARAGDHTRAEAAFASGAQFVSTDYPKPDPLISSTFQVNVPGGTIGRCNPVSVLGTCTANDIENPDALRRKDFVPQR